MTLDWSKAFKTEDGEAIEFFIDDIYCCVERFDDGDYALAVSTRDGGIRAWDFTSEEELIEKLRLATTRPGN